MLSHGTLIISLDFELYWGVHDKRRVAEYADNLKAVHQVVPRLLDLFEKYEIHATWASVGLMFAENQTEAKKFKPTAEPQYKNSKLNPYHEVDKPQADKVYYYAKPLIQLIQNTPHQEIASHTFSHYYCLEAGQSPQDFTADLTAAINIAKHNHIKLNSLVFPRNQYSPDYLKACHHLGFKTFRGNEQAWLHKPRNESELSLGLRGLRLLDSYFNLTGKHTYAMPKKITDQPLNLRSSCFLRAYMPKLRHFERLKQRRIKNAMRHAAQNNKIYHLWWHPHNFGKNTDKNFEQLEIILQYFQKLRTRYNMQSLTMQETYENYHHAVQSR